MLKAKIISQSDTKRPDYPYLGEYGYGDHRKVVLFVERGKGTVVFTTDHSLGYYSDNWIEANFEPCRDMITLVNN